MKWNFSSLYNFCFFTNISFTINCVMLYGQHAWPTSISPDTTICIIAFFTTFWVGGIGIEILVPEKCFFVDRAPVLYFRAESCAVLTDYTRNCYSIMFIIFKHGIRVGPYCTAWCGLNIWERIYSQNICDFVSFCFAAVVIDVNAFEPETIISIVCSQWRIQGGGVLRVLEHPPRSKL